MAITKVVTKDNLSLEHFKLNEETKKIETILPEQPTGVITELDFNIETKQATYKQDRVDKTVDLTPFLTDIHVSGASFEGGLLKIQRTDGQGEITIDLNTFKPPTSGTVTLDVELQDAFGEPIGFASSTQTVNVTLTTASTNA